ncbi:MAG: hypothetical protein ABL891_05345 [Burkholderiales bacterium]
MILITVLLIGTVVGISLFSLIRPRNPTLEDNVQTEQALAQARQALIAYASARLSTNRPGELPCPDTNNNGTAEANCNTAASRLGRFPWSTLGAPDLRDGSGERLWYALSSNFKNATAVTPLNSNTPGQLTVTGLAPATNVIAIVFAPGPVIAGQNRTAGNVNNAAHYLEGENSNGDTIFTSAAPSTTLNDRLLAITAGNFFPQVEMRVAREARVTLNAYFNNPGRRYFPFAHAYGGAGLCAASSQGRIPTNPVNCGGGQQTWPGGVAFPAWFFTNNWHQVLFYSVAPACTNPASPNCAGAGGLLTVNGVGGIRALLITPGTSFTGQVRPCGTITDCLEPPNTTSFPSFTHTPGSSTANDRVVIIAP